MRRFNRAHPDQTTRIPARRPLDLAVLRALFVDGDEAPAGGGAAPAAAAAAAAPAAAAPAVGADGKPVGDAAAVAAAAAAPPKPDGNIVADAKPAPATIDEQKAFLVEKGAKADDLAKLSEADLKKQFDAKKAEADKPAAKPGDVKAEDIKLTVPEGITIDEKQLTGLKEILADAKLTPAERGQKLVDMHAAALKEAANQPYLLWDKTQKDWQDSVKKDAEIGGTNFEPMKATIAKAIDSFGGKEAAAVREAFNLTGAGNNPELIRFVYRMAKAVTEPGHVNAGKPAPDGGKNPAAVLYPNQGQTKLANAG